MNCQHCDSQILDDTKQCPGCGAGVSDTESQPTPADDLLPRPLRRKSLKGCDEIGEGDKFVDGALSGNFPLAISMLPSEQQTVYQEEINRRQRHLGVAYLYYALLGVFGAQKFYVREPLWGTLYICCTLTVLGFASAAAIAGVSLDTLRNSEAPNLALAISIVVALFCTGAVAVALFFDLFCIPKQVERVNDKIRKEILVEIASRLYPDTYIPPAEQSFAFNTFAKGFAFTLISIAVLAVGISNGSRGTVKTAQEQPPSDSIAKKPPLVLAAASLMSAIDVAIPKQETTDPPTAGSNAGPQKEAASKPDHEIAATVSNGADKSNSSNSSSNQASSTGTSSTNDTDNATKNKGQEEEANPGEEFRRKRIGTVGILISQRTGKIKEIFPASDLAEVACNRGDKIIAVDGEPLPADQLRKALDGTPGTYVTILVRQEDGEEIEYEVQRKSASLFPRQPD